MGYKKFALHIVAISVVLSIALVSAGCASSTQTVETQGAAFLAQVQKNTEQARRYRSSGGETLVISIPGADFDQTIEIPMEFEVDGDHTSSAIDMSGLAQLPGGVAMGGKTQILSDLKTSYIKGGLYASLLEEAGEDLGPDQWMKVDLTALDNSEQLNALRGGELNPQSFATLLSRFDSVVTKVGEDETEGIHTTHYRGRIRFGDLMFETGVDKQFATLFGDGSHFAEDLLDTETAVDLFVSDDLYLSRLIAQLDLLPLITQLVEGGDLGDTGDDPQSAEEMRQLREEGVMKLTLDLTYFDFNSPDIKVELPADSQTVDVTEAFNKLLAMTTS